MLLFLVWAAVLAALCQIGFSGRPLSALERCSVSLFLPMIALMYAPQVSSLLLGTLSVWALLPLSMAPFVALLVYERRRISGTGTRSAFREAGRLIVSFAREATGSIYLAALSLIAAASTILVAWVFLNFWEFGWDGWTYHTAAMAWFNQQDGITATFPLMDYLASYPKNVEFLSLWVFKLSGVDEAVDGVNLIVHLAVLPFAYGVARHVGLSRYWAIAAALIYFLTPNILAQAWSTYIDGALTDGLVMMLFFYLRWEDSDREARLLWSVLLGLSMGHLAQTKGLGLHVILIMGVFLTLGELLRGRLRDRIPAIAAVAAFTFVSGAGWYIKNWIGYGNPFYPLQMTIPVLGYVLFPGTDIADWASVAHLGEEPMWLTYFSRFAEVNASPLAVDDRFGGWGAHFFFLGLPAAAVAAWTGSPRLRQLLLFGLAYFLVVPMSYWGRYSLVGAFLGALAFAHVAQDVLGSTGWRRFLSAMSVGALLLSSAQIFAVTWQDADRRTDIAAFADREGFRRFALVHRYPGSSIGIAGNLEIHADNPNWYFYFGPEWKNHVEPFQPARAHSYDFVVCYLSGPCPELETHDEVVMEDDVVVLQKRVSR